MPTLVTRMLCVRTRLDHSPVDVTKATLATASTAPISTSVVRILTTIVIVSQLARILKVLLNAHATLGTQGLEFSVMILMSAVPRIHATRMLVARIPMALTSALVVRATPVME